MRAFEEVRVARFLLVFAAVSAVAGCGALLGFGDDDPPASAEDGGLDGAAADVAILEASGEGAAGDGAGGDNDGALPPKRVFVTRERFTGAFGGRAQAD